MLKRRVTNGPTANAVFLSFRAEILSGPVDLHVVVSKLESSLMMSSSEHSRATGNS